MKYIGEHAWAGQLGHFFVLLSLVASLVATIAFFQSTRNSLADQEKSWRRLGRWAFLIQAFSVFAVFGILYIIISNHYFEYKYAWQHSSRALQVKYLLSCFWEGQEGSFLLWSIWHCIIGMVLMRTARKMEGQVMTVLSFAQFCLATMLLGIYFFNFKVGSSPFILSRNSEMGNIPLFKLADYASKIPDGNGLNVLLQNYWMVIHPPVLFLGFASTIVPFAYAISALWKRDHKTWVKAALPWTLFATCILGVGIMMGAAWAYESLTFGGYWAWDPVENASMVPWLILVAGLHTLLVYKHTGYSLRAAYLFLILGFLFILYSTFLTRSGVLGDTSVHSFVDLGMNLQLTVFLLIFTLPALTLYIARFKSAPVIAREEKTNSREFWMFIGSLVFVLSALIIISQTSVPLFNKILGKKNAPGDEVEFSYNRVQIFVAIVIGLLTAVTQYFKYKDTPKAYFRRKIWMPLLVAVVASALISIFGGINYDKYGIGFLAAIHLGIFAAIFSVVANTAYIWLGMKGKLRVAGGSVAHLGFALMLLGILISSAKKTTLSLNNTGFSPLKMGEKESPLENLSLPKGLAVDMGKYNVTYTGNYWDSSEGKKFYNIEFNSKDGKEKFVLKPDVIPNNKGAEGLTPNPDARHYWNKDIFTYLTYVRDPADVKDTAQFREQLMGAGDTLYYSKGFLVLDSVVANPTNSRYNFGKSDTSLMAAIRVVARSGSIYKARPLLFVKNGVVNHIEDTVSAESLIFRFHRVETSKINLGVKESNAMLDLVTLKVYEFPYINVLWLGIILMAIGTGMSMIHRIRLNRASRAA